MATAAHALFTPIYVPASKESVQGMSLFGKLRLVPSLEHLVHEQAAKLVKPGEEPYKAYDALSPNKSRTVIQKAIQKAEILTYCTNPDLLKVCGIALAVWGFAFPLALAPLNLIAVALSHLILMAGAAAATFGFIKSDRLQQLSTDYQKAAETGRALFAQLHLSRHVLVLPLKPVFIKEEELSNSLRAGPAELSFLAQSPLSFPQPYSVRKGDSLSDY